MIALYKGAFSKEFIVGQCSLGDSLCPYMKIQLRPVNSTDYSPLNPIDIAEGTPHLLPLSEDLILCTNGEWKKVIRRRFVYEENSVTVFLECAESWPMEDPKIAAERRRELREQEPPEFREPRYTGRDCWME